MTRRAGHGGRLALGLVAALLASGGTTPASAEPGPPAWWESTRLLDDPAGARSRLEDLGVELQLFYNQVLAGKPAGGGADPDGVFGHSASYDLFALVDVEALAGWPGLDVLLHVKGQYDDNVNEAVGALSDPIDDADFDEPIYVDELWLQQALLRDRVRLRLGFLEQQTVFDRNAYANSEDRQFLSTYLDNNGLVPLPNGLGAVLILAPASWLEVALGAADAENVPRDPGFDSAFDDLGSVTGYLELDFRSRLASPWGQLPGAWRAGVFLDGRKLPVFGTTESERGHLGAYLSLDQLAYSEEAGSEQGLGLFARFGMADPDVSRVAWFWSTGFQYCGALPGRDEDILGLGVYQAIGSDRYRRTVDPDFDRETGIELYYRLQALGWLTVTPDFQYIIDPGATGAADDAIVAALRLRVTF